MFEWYFQMDKLWVLIYISFTSVMCISQCLSWLINVMLLTGGWFNTSRSRAGLVNRVHCRMFDIFYLLRHIAILLLLFKVWYISEVMCSSFKYSSYPLFYSIEREVSKYININTTGIVINETYNMASKKSLRGGIINWLGLVLLFSLYIIKYALLLHSAGDAQRHCISTWTLQQLRASLFSFFFSAIQEFE